MDNFSFLITICQMIIWPIINGALRGMMPSAGFEETTPKTEAKNIQVSKHVLLSIYQNYILIMCYV